jgi:hypothetical protein
LLFTVTSTACLDFHFFKLTQPLTISVKNKGGNQIENHTLFPYGLRNPYRNLKSENSQDYAQKHQRETQETLMWRCIPSGKNRIEISCHWELSL